MVSLSGEAFILLFSHLQATFVGAQRLRLCSLQWCSVLGSQTSLTLTPAALGEANPTGAHRFACPWL